MRLLDRAGIAYSTRHYDLAIEEFSAAAVADLIGIPARQVFKTLIARGDRTGHCFAVIPADTELDLKALAAARGDRKVALVPVAEVEEATGYRRGSVTVIGAKRAFPVVLDASAMHLDQVAVSGGAKGVQIVLTTDDYVGFTGAELAAIAEPTSTGGSAV